MSLARDQNPRPERQFLPHATPPWVDAHAIFFLTICCMPRGANQLCHRSVADVLFETVAFRQTRGDWFIHLLVLMPDPLHALVSFPRDTAMRKVVSTWKEITAKKTGIRWQRDFFDHRLRGNEGYAEKAHYIRMNPVRAGLVSSCAAWPYVGEPTTP